MTIHLCDLCTSNNGGGGMDLTRKERRERKAAQRRCESAVRGKIGNL
jgi:hypothetical protein